VGICKDWRKPDISAVFKGKKVVFELQLNTTFLSVIIERNLFYQNNQTYIRWVFDNKQRNIDNMRFMGKDIIYPNKHNAFFINENANDGQFKLVCGYEKPVVINGSIKNVWQLKNIDFGELTFGTDFQIFWFDYEKEKKSLAEEIERNKISEFGNKWQAATYEERGDLIKEYRNIFLDQCKQFNFNELSNLFDCLYSIKYKKVIGYNYVRIVQLLHQYLDKDAARDLHFGEYIFKAIRIYAKDYIKNEDRTEKLINKAIAYRKKGFRKSDKYDTCLKLLFPELFLEEKSK
jgi:hypothetical protein